MILRRLGNKSKIALEIQKYFPEHKIYVEPFFGAGGMFFNKPKAPYNIVNDLDNDVFNLFQVIIHRKEEFIDVFNKMPIHEGLLKHWKQNKETDEILKAMRFIFISNFTFMGAGSVMRFGADSGKNVLFANIDETQKRLEGVQFSNSDFKSFFKKIGISNTEDIFIYCDPPYLDTDDNYESSFTEKDSEELFALLVQSKCKFALSEFDHPFIIEQANKYKLNINLIGERQNLKNRRIEVLITNYKNNQLTLF